MRLLCFQAKRFYWRTHTKTLNDIPDLNAEDEDNETIVAFIHSETIDGTEDRHISIFRQALKHIKWLANKRDLRNIVLHSFTNLGGDTAEPAAAKATLDAIAERLQSSGYQVKTTPFGYNCEWEISVYGESLAKVWKEIR